jgi:hypothetical protein
MKGCKRDSVHSLEHFFEEGLNYNAILQRVGEKDSGISPHICNIIKFWYLTGLRPSRAVAPVQLIVIKMTL